MDKELKITVKVKNAEKVLSELKRANELLKELGNIFQGYDGLAKGLELELVPAQENMLAQEFIHSSKNQ